MSFNIGYNFLASDKFSRIADKVRRAQEKVNKAGEKGVKVNNRLARSAALVGKKFGSAKRSLGGFAKKLGTVKGLLIGAGVLIGLKKMVTVGATFEDSLAELSAITGITGDKLERLGMASREFGKEFAELPSNVVLAIKEIASAKSELIKMDGALENVTRGALLLSKASGVSLQDSVVAVTASLNQFSEAADQADRFVNVLAAGAKVGASEVQFTVAAIKDSGKVASDSNVSFEQLNAAVQVLARGNIKGSQAGINLRNILLKLDTTVAKLAPGVTGFTERLELLRKANLDSSQAIKIFGVENITAAKILIDNAPLLKKWTKELTGTNVAQEQANIRLATFSTRIKRIGIEIRTKLIDIFFKMEPQLISLTEKFKGFLDSIGPEQITVFAGRLADLARIMGGLLTILSKVARFTDVLFRRETIAGAAIGFATAGPVGAIIGGAVGAAGGSAVRSVAGGGAAQKGVDGVDGKSTIEVNINAPPGVVQSVKAKSKGPTKLNVGQNLRFAGGTL